MYNDVFASFNSKLIYRGIKHLKFNLTDASDSNAMPFAKRQCQYVPSISVFKFYLPYAIFFFALSLSLFVSFSPIGHKTVWNFQ